MALSKFATHSNTISPGTEASASGVCWNWSLKVFLQPWGKALLIGINARYIDLLVAIHVVNLSLNFKNIFLDCLFSLFFPWTLSVTVSFKFLLSLQEVPVLNLSHIYSLFIPFSMGISPAFIDSNIILCRFCIYICSIGSRFSSFHFQETVWCPSMNISLTGKM